MDMDDVVMLSPTGGTSGKPKGVMNTHRSLPDLCRALPARLPLTGQRATGQSCRCADDAYRGPAVAAVYRAGWYGGDGRQTGARADVGGNRQLPGHRVFPATDGDLQAAGTAGDRAGGFLLGEVPDVRRRTDVDREAEKSHQAVGADHDRRLRPDRGTRQHRLPAARSAPGGRCAGFRRAVVLGGTPQPSGPGRDHGR